MTGQLLLTNDATNKGETIRQIEKQKREEARHMKWYILEQTRVGRMPSIKAKVYITVNCLCFIATNSLKNRHLLKEEKTMKTRKFCNEAMKELFSIAFKSFFSFE